jgi:prophage maintenance system killer protein
VAKAHAFIDGNKRIAFAMMVAFLKAHGARLDTPEAEATQTKLEHDIFTLTRNLSF